ncbi:MAG: LON peptidase substrate-binding domain-containing protein [Bacteroidales bacterium]
MEDYTKDKAGLVLVSEFFPDSVTVLPLESRPVFPGLTLPLAFANKIMVQQVEHALKNNDGFIGVSLIKELDEKIFTNSEVFRTGTLLKIIRVINKSDDTVQFLAQALSRCRLRKKFTRQNIPYWHVQYDSDETQPTSEEIKAYTLAVINSVKELIKLNPMFQEQMRLTISQVGLEKPGLLMDLVASFLTAEGYKLQDLLETTDLFERSEKLLLLLKEEIELSQLQQDIQKQIEEKVSKQQREFFLREQLKVIKKELGMEKDEKAAEIEKIEQKIRKLNLSEEAAKVVNEELLKLKTIEPISPEYQVSRTYLNWLTDLPWGIYSTDNYDLVRARKILDEDHYGLQDVKQRILEFISTIVKRGRVSGTIICLVGPPGVGKTSVGKSIANALNRKFYRFSLGGMRDEAEIKGHRRTYIGAMPGKFIQSLKRTGVANPTVMLDEIDKIGISFQGDPASALLEVLDPEQNNNFLDHYLDVRFDLSNILFITTA